MRCRDQRYCEASTGIPGTTDCALGVEGTTQRIICELAHAPDCHRWKYKGPGMSDWERCLVAQHPVASCDHFDHWIEWQGPYTGPCETNPSGAPIAGWDTVMHGKVEAKACGNGPSANVCSNVLQVDCCK